MKRIAAEKKRDIDFSKAGRGAVVPSKPGKTKISIQFDNAILERFRSLADRAGGGNDPSLINDALREYIERESTMSLVRQVVREEMATCDARKSTGERPSGKS